MTPETMDSRPELADVSPAMWERIDAIIAADPRPAGGDDPGAAQVPGHRRATCRSR